MSGSLYLYFLDQGEALTMSDRVAVMNEGEQVGQSNDVYNFPQTPFVATLEGK